MSPDAPRVTFAFKLLSQTQISQTTDSAQLTSWVLPMTIAGRLMKMEYNEIAVGLVALAVAKTALEAGEIIHY